MTDHIHTTFKMAVIEGDVTERMADRLLVQKKRGQGNISRSLHDWSTGGFILEELGYGILEAWLSMERNGELRGLSKKDKATQFIRMLSWCGEAPAPLPEVAPAPPKSKNPIGAKAPR